MPALHPVTPSRRHQQRSVHSLHPLPDVGRTFVSGFESTYHPGTGVDSLDVTGHAGRWQQDLAHVAASGVRHVRYPLRWHRIQPARGTWDWSETDRVLGHLRDTGMVPLVDLVHHTSYPDWLSDGFRGADFGQAYGEYARAVADRYPWIPAYTLFNEPFATLFLAGHAALWPPYEKGVTGMRRLYDAVLPAVAEAAQHWRQALPHAHHVWVDTAERHSGNPAGAEYAALANDRRHVALDLLLGRDLDLTRPFLRTLVRDEEDPLLHLPPLAVDVLGLDYYSHSEWYYDEQGAHAPSPHPVGFAAVAAEYFERYGLPMMLTETNLRGVPSDRSSWLRYMVEQYDVALDRGLPLHGFCWFPHVDSTDWDSLLARCAGRADPVGVLSLDADGSRVATTFTRVWQRAAAGAPVEELPAATFQPPNDELLRGYAPAFAGWSWQRPVGHELVPTVPTVPTETAYRSRGAAMVGDAAADAADLVVLSHLRWTWVWQRPQHLVSRLAAERAPRGGRTWFVEEPCAGDVAEPVLRWEDVDGVRRVWLEVPGDPSCDRMDFDDPRAEHYPALLSEHLAAERLGPARDVWIYTPMATELGQVVGGRLVYDVMDDLASFKDAPPELVLRQRRLLTLADVVFTGGPSLHRSVCRQRTRGVHLFRSGVDTEHYRSSRTRRSRRGVQPRPVAGYVGVIDERLDLDLLAEAAQLLPHWTLRLVGPVAKIDPTSLPRRDNLEYPGMASYDTLPEVMAGFDVALMPFALNEATASISPTKTLEYLAAGLPVVSTRVPDVVADHSAVVHLVDDADGLAAACRRALREDGDARDRIVAPMLARQEWDHIATSMSRLLTPSVAGATATDDAVGRDAFADAARRHDRVTEETA